jgi:Ni,Fe-hydrogenase I cytochrome b subunit
MGDHSQRQVACDGAAMASVFRLAFCDQRADFHRLCFREPTCHSRPGSTGKDFRGIGKSLRDHLLLRHPSGKEAKRYNVLQKLAYACILFGVAPLIVLTGLAMSPTIDTAFPWLLTILGGRQAARTIHFVACFSFVGFIVIHVVQVILTGFFNNIRSMVTGWFLVQHKGVRHEV